jgi:hypothetical protein
MKLKYKKTGLDLNLQNIRIFIRFLVALIFFNLVFMDFCLCQIRSKKIESRIKASYIYNCTKFVYWDPSKGDLSQNIIFIYFLGGDSIFEILRGYSEMQSGNHPINVKKISRIKSDIKECNLLFIGESEQNKLNSILKQVDGSRILTISDIPEFAHNGGMIGFIDENSKLKIEINLNAVLKAGLKISAKFLKIAKII